MIYKHILMINMIRFQENINLKIDLLQMSNTKKDNVSIHSINTIFIRN